MPLQSAHVFASHIGHTGKTTLCYQMACYYAQRHPDIRVLVMDLAEEGDLTKRLLGGVDAAREKTDELFGGAFRLLTDAGKKTSGLTSWLWSNSIDLSQHATQVRQHNPAIPDNLFLISSGAWPTAEEHMPSDERKRICGKIQESLEKSEATWKLFCDTDGDRRPSAFTMIGYGLCPHAIVPLHLNKGDLDRTETMMGVLQELRAKDEIKTQVALIIWNFVNVIKDEPMQHNGNSLPFTTTKVSLDILDTCNARLCDVRKDLPGLFVHGDLPDKDFLNSSTTVLRQLADNVLKPSEEIGKPFVQIVDELGGRGSIKFKSGKVEYSATAKVVANVDEALRNIEAKFEAMSLSAPAPSGAAGY